MRPHLGARSLGPGEWFACSRPEAPDDDFVVYDSECRACVLALGAHSRASVGSVYRGTVPENPAEVYESLREGYGLPPLPAPEVAR